MRSAAAARRASRARTIVENVATSIVEQRARPHFFVLSEDGCPLLWTRDGPALNSAIVRLVDEFLTGERRSAEAHVTADGTVVRIVPESTGLARRVAVVVERFASR